MNHHTKIAHATLLKRSQEQSSYQKATSEWKTSHEMKDFLASTGECQLCGKTPIRYQYKIINKLNHNMLWVGSECIKKFGISVEDEDGNILTGKAAKNYLESLKQEEQQKMRIQPIQKLYDLSAPGQKKFIAPYIGNRRDAQSLSPKVLLRLFQKMLGFNIKYPASLYKVKLRSDQQKQELYEMTETEFSLIRPALSPQQRNTYPQKKHEHDKRIAAKKIAQEKQQTESQSRYTNHTDSLSSTITPSPKTVHTIDRFTVQFFDGDSNPLHVAHRNNEADARRVAEHFINRRSNHCLAEVHDSHTELTFYVERDSS